MGRQPKIRNTPGEQSILGDELVALMQAQIDELKSSIVDLRFRVDAQFTTIAAHAEIARAQAETARCEARADLERTRDMLIGLVEVARSEAHATTFPPPDPIPELPAEAASGQLSTLESRLSEVADAVAVCFDRQREFADTMSAFIDTMLADRPYEPSRGLSPV